MAGEAPLPCPLTSLHLHAERALLPAAPNAKTHGAEAAAVLHSAPAWIRQTGILHYNLACYEARLGDLATARREQFRSVQLIQLLASYGYMGIEEDVVVTPEGVRFLGERQTDLILIGEPKP